MPDLITIINDRIDYLDYYTEFLPDKPNQMNGDEWRSRCPFHNDKNPSFSFNVKTGLWHCHAGCGSGNVFSFTQKVLKYDSNEVTKFICTKLGIEQKTKNIIPKEEIMECHLRLLKNKVMMNQLTNLRGFTVESIKKFKLGFLQGRVTIPIQDDVGDYVNVRRYSFNGKSANKMLSYKAGYGAARLFPLNSLKKDTVIICEGEMDCILLNQYGFPAITVTSGAGTWKSYWTELFRGKTVYLCFDIDNVGKQGAKKIAELIKQVTKRIYIIHLPLTEPANADITDYFINQGNTLQDFKLLLQNTKEYQGQTPDGKIIKYQKMDLEKASQSKNYFKAVELKVLVVGKDLSPYMVPEEMEISCDMSHGKVCPFCPIGLVNGCKKIHIDLNSEQILEMIQISKNQLDVYLRRLIGIPQNCYVYKYKVIKAMNVEEIRLIPDIDFHNDDQKYVVRQAYYLGHGIETNKVYTFRGLTIPDPKTQYVTHMIKQAEKSMNSIDTFKMNSKLKKQLKIFKLIKESK